VQSTIDKRDGSTNIYFLSQYDKKPKNQKKLTVIFFKKSTPPKKIDVNKQVDKLKKYYPALFGLPMLR
jgi:hypothetical protein